MADESRFSLLAPRGLWLWALLALNGVILTLGLWGASQGGSRGGGFPSHAVELVVPFGPGGGTDTYARIIKQAIDDEGLLGQPLVIINRGGAGATIGSRYVKDAKPDGYTMLVLHDAIITAQASGLVDYGPDAFEPVAATGEVGMVIAVSAQSEFETLDDLMDAARERPDTVTFGANLGALTHYAGLMLEQADARKHDPGAVFRYAQAGGGAERFADLTGGHFDVTGFSIEEFTRYRPGGLRGLAYFGEQRHPAAPDVPTAREQGYDVINRNTFYWWVPKGTPRKRIDVLAAALEGAVETDYVKARMAELHTTPLFIRGAELRERLEATRQAIAGISAPQKAAVPNFAAIIGAITALLAVGAVVQSLRNRARRADVVGGFTPRYWLAAAAVVLTVAYIASMAVLRVDFRIATVSYVLAVGLLLSGWHWRALPAAGFVALTLAFGIHALSTRVFDIALP